MRHELFAAVALAAVAFPAGAQRTTRRGDNTARNTRSDDRVISTSDTRFTPSLRSGDRLSLSNIDGKITVTQGRGQSAEIVAHKVVRRGDGDLVKAVMEQTSGGVRVCTVYLDDRNDDRGCNRTSRNNHNGNRDPLDVDMEYEVRIPSGVVLAVNTVDGSVEARGIDTPGTIRTVDGSITYDGVAPEGLNTVDGSITATITDRDWNHGLAVRTVDGAIDLTLPANTNARLSGHTVDGNVDSDFPITLTGRWGPQSFNGDIGDGRGPALDLSSVDGNIRLRSTGGKQDAPARRRGRP